MAGPVTEVDTDDVGARCQEIEPPSALTGCNTPDQEYRTVTGKDAVLELPAWSVAVQVTVVSQPPSPSGHSTETSVLQRRYNVPNT